MTDVSTFLSEHGWSDARHIPLAGDASARRYIRLYLGNKRAILMVDPQDQTKRFETIAKHLDTVGLSAPKVIAMAPGLMLLEDLGDDQFVSVIKNHPESENRLYRAATDVLCYLETASCPADLGTAKPPELGAMIEPAFTHYLPMFGLHEERTKTELTERLTEALDAYLPPATTLVLRDYHAENLIWLPDRAGMKRVGLLDFQDALIGPPIYDLVSMLQDARRDVSLNCQSATLKHYATLSGRQMDTILPAFHLLGLQRNLRILGVFARLALENGKPAYLDLIPRVWGHVMTSLQSPTAVEIAPILQRVFPTPTPDRLSKIKRQCQTP